MQAMRQFLFLVAALTVLATVCAYTFRPSLAIAVGDYPDAAFLQDFHAREVDSAGEGQTAVWPKEQRQLTLPGRRSGDWLALIQADSSQPAEILDGLALTVNGKRVSIPRSDSRQFLAFIPADLAESEQLTLELVPALAGEENPPLGLVDKVTFEPARTYRWTREESKVNLPGLGSGAWLVKVAGIIEHPDHRPLQAQIFANEALLGSFPEANHLRKYQFLVPAKEMGRGDLTLTLRSATFTDPRPLGLLVTKVEVAPLKGGFPLPPWQALLSCLAIMLTIAFCLRTLLEGQTKALLWATLGTGGIGLIGVWAIINYRFPTSFMLPSLALLALWSLGLLLILQTFLPKLCQIAGIAFSPSTLHAFILIFLLGYWLKAGGMLYPYFIGIDLHWHMERVRWIFQGQLSLLYGINSPLNESTMPTAEWGENKPVIPYSPYFHIFATSFALFPWALEQTGHQFSALLDSSRTLIIGILALKIGLRERGAKLAALLCAILPVTFLLHSWGNLPTTFGLWWICITTTFIVIGWQKLRRPLPFSILTFLLLATFLFYTVAGIFQALFLIFFTLLLWLITWRKPQSKDLHIGLKPLWLATFIAATLAIVVYYGQYIGPIVERTIPYFTQALGNSSEVAGKGSEPFVAYFARHTRLWYYGLALPLVLSCIWVGKYNPFFSSAMKSLDLESNRLKPKLFSLGVNSFSCWVTAKAVDSARGISLRDEKLAERIIFWTALTAWLGIMFIFFFLGAKVSMVDKHFFVLIPFLTIASADLLDDLWDKNRFVRGSIILFYGYLAWSALTLWLYRIGTVRQ